MTENEKVYFDEGGVTVTNARFIVGTQTYAMSGITSVKTTVDLPLMWPAMLVFGGIVSIAMADEVIFGLLFIAGAIIWFIKGINHIVILSSASGEVKAISSRDAGFVGRIIAALNDAIVDRG